jgi:HNH endonuclease
MDTLDIILELMSLDGEYDFLMHNGELIPNYYVDKKGNIFSTKWGKLKKLIPKVSGQSPYPTVTIRHNGKTKTVRVHRLVCESIYKLPKKYPGISDTVWKNTPEIVKKELIKHMQVNHKDGNPKNFHPNNLEWTTPQQNRKHYHTELRVKRKA